MAKASTAGNQQHHADHRAHGEILLADDLLVSVSRKHIELSANHFGDAEIRHHQREHNKAGVDQAELGAGQCHGAEDARLRGAQRIRHLIEARIRQRQRSHEDNECMREAIENLCDHDSRRAVDRSAKQETFQQALIAEQIDQ